MSLNPELVKLARFTVGKQRQKVAFQPPGGDPSQDPAAAGGAPPMDPAAGGMPPMDPAMAGGAPPMDPAAAGGMPMDPAMMGGAPPAPPAPDPAAGGGGSGPLDAIMAKMDQMMQSMQMSPQNQAGPGGAPGGPGKPGKPDLLAMSMDIFQMKKMLSALFDAMGIPIPQDILDGPNRDPATGAPMPAGMPGSTSDPQRQSPAMGGGGGGAGPDSAIKPIGAMKGAFPAAGGGGGDASKAAAASRIGEEFAAKTPLGREMRNKASALATMLRRKTRI
jgi:hypothetical protein